MNKYVTSEVECIKTSSSDRIRVASVAQIDKELDQLNNRKNKILCCLKRIQEMKVLFEEHICKYCSVENAKKIKTSREEKNSNLIVLQSETDHTIEKLQNLKGKCLRINELMRSLDEWIQVKYSEVCYF